MQLTLLTIVTNYYSQSSSPKHVGFHASASGAISVQRFTRRRCWTVASKSTSASTATSAERAIDAIVGPGPMCLARQKRVKWVVACGNMWIKLGIWLYMNHMNILCIIYVCIYMCVCVVPALLQQRRHDSGDVLARPIWCGRLMVTTYLMMVKRRMMTMMTMIMIYYDHDDGDDAGDHQIIRSSTTTIIIIIALFKIKVWSMFSHGL